MSAAVDPSWRRRLPWCAAILFCLLVDLALIPAIFDDSIRAPGDVVQHFPPNWSAAPRTPIRNAMVQDWVVQFQSWQRLVRDSWLSGRPPLWNQLSGCGAPLAANMQSEAYSPYLPLNLIAHEQYPDWRQLAQLLVAQLSCFWLAKRLKIGVFGALVMALGYSFTYYMQAWALHPHSASASFAPAILAAFLGLRLGPRPTQVVVLALLIAGSLLAGHIETAFKQTLAAGLLAFFWVPRPALELVQRLRFAVAAVSAGVLAMCLAAVLLVPFAEMVESSTLLRIRSGNTAMHLDLAHLATLLDHEALGSEIHGREPYRAVRNYLESSFFIGRTLLLLALAGLVIGFRRRPGLVLPLTGLALFPFLILHGPEVWQDSLAQVPPFGAMLMSRLVFMATLPICVLAGLGIDWLWTGRGERPIERLVFLAVAIIVGLLILLVVESTQSPEIIQVRWWSWALVAAGLAALAGIALPQRIGRSLALTFLMAGIVAEGLIAWRDFVPTVPVTQSRPQSLVFDSLAARAGDERALFVSLIPPGVDTPTPVNRLRRYDAVESRRFDDMLYLPPISPLGGGFEIGFARSETLDAMGLGWLVTPFPAAAAVRPKRKHLLKAGASIAVPSQPGMELIFLRPSGVCADGTISLTRGGEAPLAAVIGAAIADDQDLVTEMDGALKQFLSVYLPLKGVHFLRVIPRPTASPVVISLAVGAADVEVYELSRQGLGSQLEECEAFSNWIRITERLSTMPLAYLANQVATTTCRQSAMELFRAPTWRPQNQTIVEIEEFDEEPIVVTKEEDVRAVAISRVAPGEFRVQLPSEEGGLLVLCESFAPGWFCRHELGESAAMPANVGMMAFRLPPGLGEVSLVYCPRSFQVGAWLSALTLLGMIIVVVGGIWKRR